MGRTDVSPPGGSMELLTNPFRDGSGILSLDPDVPVPSVRSDRPLDLLARCPADVQTPLLARDDLARMAGVRAVHIKDERTRMGLGSVEALGAAYAIAQDADASNSTDMGSALTGVTYVAARAGAHGLAVAMGARAFGARSVIYIPQCAPETVADRLRAKGAEVVREGGCDTDSHAAAVRASKTEGWRLLSDTSWPGYTDRPLQIMEGYLVLMEEVLTQIPVPPSHVFVQARAGGFAAACATLARRDWGAEPRIIVVEPDAPAGLGTAIQATARGSTHEPAGHGYEGASVIAMQGLARDADVFARMSEADVEDAVERLAEMGLASTPKGVSGIAALLASAPHRAALHLTSEARVLAILSEGCEI